MYMYILNACTRGFFGEKLALAISDLIMKVSIKDLPFYFISYTLNNMLISPKEGLPPKFPLIWHNNDIIIITSVHVHCNTVPPVQWRCDETHVPLLHPLLLIWTWHDRMDQRESWAVLQVEKKKRYSRYQPTIKPNVCNCISWQVTYPSDQLLPSLGYYDQMIPLVCETFYDVVSCASCGDDDEGQSKGRELQRIHSCGLKEKN